MKIAIGNDHAATELKFIIMDYVKSLGHEVVNFGTDGNESCNYPEFGEKVGRAVDVYKRQILQSAVNSLGSDAVAAMTAGSKIGMFFCCPFDALGLSLIHISQYTASWSATILPQKKVYMNRWRLWKKRRRSLRICVHS